MSAGRGIRRCLLGACLLVAALVAPTQVSAHPLGNFTINHLSQVRVSQDRVAVHYILDQAEIPTFQELQRYDSDGSGRIDGAERGPLLERKLAEIAPGLQLSADGRRVALGPPADVRLTFPPGQAGLLLTRLEADFSAALPAGAGRVSFHDRTYDGRVGWKAIQVMPGEGTDVRSSVPSTDPTDGLRAYPVDLLQSPPDVRDASFAVSEGDGQVTAPDGPDGGPVTTDRAQDGFAGALAGGNTHGWLILLLLAAAAGWGALHALSPGHGKSMVAAYLVGSRGTPRHAVILGVTVTITHTFAVFALGLVTLFASQYILPEDLYPWLGIASGVSVIVVGFVVMRTRFLRWRALRGAEVRGSRLSVADGPGHSHDQSHSHPPDHGHAHTHAEGHGHSHDHPHEHKHGHTHGHADGHDHAHEHGHSHHPPEGPITMRGLLALGISGGAVPCPSALVVLIAAISQHRIGLGMILILAFSVGLAATLTAVGLGVLYGGRLIERLRPERRLFGGRIVGAMPALSASLIILAGVLITMRAIPQLG